MTRIPNTLSTNDTELPAFFQTGNRVVYECLEEDCENAVEQRSSMNNLRGVTLEGYCSDDSTYMSIEDDAIDEPVLHQHAVLRDENVLTTDGIDDETITFELLDFFDNVAYDDMDEHFRAFEYGDSWVSNPIFTDEFAFTALPIAFSNIIYELNTILQIQRVAPSDWNRNDRRYSSLSRPQQLRLQEVIRENPDQLNQLDDLRNRIRGYRCRTGSPQIKFLLNKTIEVVDDLLVGGTNGSP